MAMRHIILTLTAVAMTACLLSPHAALAWRGTVVSVHDGDSIIVESPTGKRVRIRIYGVDCPELRQPYGPEAKAMTERVVLGQEVDVIPAQKAKSYRREVAGIVMLDALVVLQDVLVSTGLAWVDDRYCKLPICDLWRLHQRDAKEADPPRGLWEDGEVREGKGGDEDSVHRAKGVHNKITY